MERPVPAPTGASRRTPRSTSAPASCSFFNYGKEAPYLHYGVVDAERRARALHRRAAARPAPAARHGVHRELRRSSTTSRCSGTRRLLAKGVHVARFHPDLPTRFARHPAPRADRATSAGSRPTPTYVLHFVNAYEDGDEIVLDGFFQGDPAAAATTAWATGGSGPSATSPSTACRPRLHRWRLNLRTGAVKEEQLCRQHHRVRHDQRRATAGGPYRYAYATTGKPGWFLFDGLVKHDLETGHGGALSPSATASSAARRRWRRGPAAPAEDDGYLVTFTTDMNDDAPSAVVFDAARVADGPGRAAAAARADLERHPLHLGARRRAAALEHGGHGSGCDRSLSRRSTTSTPAPCRPRSSPGGRTPSAACSGCSATSGPCSSSSERCAGRPATASSSTRSPISNAVLSARLATMEREGLLRRVVYQQRPVRAEYVLTPRGRVLAGHDRDLGVGASLGAAPRADASRDAAPAVRAELRPGPDLPDVP